MPEMMKRRMTVDDLDQSVAERLDVQTQQLTESISSSIAAVSSAADQQVAKQVTELREDVDAIKSTLAQVTSALVDLRQDVKAGQDTIAAGAAKPAEDTTSDERFQELAGKVDSVSEDVRRMEDVLNAFRSEVDVSSIFDEPRAAIQKQSDAAQEAILAVQTKTDGLVQAFEKSSQEALESFGKKADAAISSAEERLAGVSAKAKSEMDGVTAKYKASADKIEKKIDDNRIDTLGAGSIFAGGIIAVFIVISSLTNWWIASRYSTQDATARIDDNVNRILWNQVYVPKGGRMYSPFESGFVDDWNNQNKYESGEQQKQQEAAQQ